MDKSINFPDIRFAYSFLRLHKEFYKCLAIKKDHPIYISSSTPEERMKIKLLIADMHSPKDRSLMRRWYADYLKPIRYETVPLSNEENNKRIRKLKKVMYKLNNSTIFHLWLKKNKHYRNALEILVKKNGILIRWYSEGWQPFDDNNTENYRRFALEVILAKVYIMLPQVEYPHISKKIKDSELTSGISSRLSDKSIALAKKLRYQLEKDFEGELPTRNTAIVINRLADGKASRSGQVKNILISEKTRNKLIIREISLHAHRYFYFRNSINKRFPTRIMEELLPLFGVHMTTRNIDLIMTKYTLDEVRSAFEEKDKPEYYMKPIF